MYYILPKPTLTFNTTVIFRYITFTLNAFVIR